MRGVVTAKWAMIACAAVVAAGTLAPSAALACGGCFSPVLPPAPGQPNGGAVLQSAERVVFLRDEATKVSRVWVEVRYTGVAKDFGWVLPLPKAPTVTVGTTAGLDLIDQATSARYIVQPLGKENCRDPQDGCEIDPDDQSADASGGFMDAGVSSDAAPGGGGVEGITILDQGQAGPYDYAVIQGKDATVLQTWLDTRGYKTPSTAVPILQSHADKGDVFVAIKLQNGKGIELIRPVVLEMQDAEPCVPLRLTSIAAADELNVVVTLAGSGRAVPKNMLHVQLNHARLNWLANVNNYEQVVSAAIDEAAGRAFHTESALPGGSVAAALPTDAALDVAWAEKATNIHELAVGLYLATSKGGPTLWTHPDAAKVFAEKAGIVEPIFQVFKVSAAPAVLAQLWTCGAVWSGSVAAPSGSEVCIPAGESFFSPTVTWSAAAAKLVPVNGVALAAGLTNEIVTPLKKLREGFATANTATRMVMKIGPTEMDRDPVFAFHATLPGVPRDRVAKVGWACESGWLPQTHRRVEIPGVGSYLMSVKATSSATDPRFAKAPFAATIEVLDENGAPLPVPVGKVELVDAALAGATPGKPSPVTQLVLGAATPWQPPASDAPLKKVTPWKKPGWCPKVKPGWVDGKLPPGTTGGGDTDAGSGAGDADGGGGEDTGAPADVVIPADQDSLADAEAADGLIADVGPAGGGAGAAASAGVRDSGCGAASQGAAGPSSGRALAVALALALAGYVVMRRRRTLAARSN